MRNTVASADGPETLAVTDNVLNLVAGTLAVLCLGEPCVGAFAVCRQRFRCHRDEQVMPGPDRVATQIVGGANLCNRRVVFQCDLGDRFAVLYFMALPADAFLRRYIRKRRIECVGARPRCRFSATRRLGTSGESS